MGVQIPSGVPKKEVRDALEDRSKGLEDPKPVDRPVVETLPGPENVQRVGGVKAAQQTFNLLEGVRFPSGSPMSRIFELGS